MTGQPPFPAATTQQDLAASTNRKHLRGQCRLATPAGGGGVVGRLRGGLIPAREVDDDVGRYLDRRRQDPHDRAVHLLPLRGGQLQVRRDGRQVAHVVA